MTTTHDVPMPEPSIRCALFAEEHKIIVAGEYFGPWPPTDRGPMSYAYTADQLRAYADARCAKLQEEVVTWRGIAEGEAELRGLANEEIEDLKAERDALAEKVKAMEDNDRRYRWLRTFPNNVRPHVYAPCGLLMREEHLDAAIDAAGGDKGGAE